MFNTMHLFAGQGGGLLADLILEHNPIVAVEIDKYACELLREKTIEGWFPNLYVWEGDVRLFDPSEYKGKVDCIHAGFPCQDISVAGKQAGLKEGTRSGLYREVLRIAGQIRPEYIFLENVAAIINNGIETVITDISKMGYDCRWCVVSASDVGANHQRDRWWCLCILRNAESFRNTPIARGKSKQVGTEVIGQQSNIRHRLQGNGRQCAEEIWNTKIIYDDRTKSQKGSNRENIIRKGQLQFGRSNSSSDLHATIPNTYSKYDFRRGKSQQSNSQSRKTWNKSEGGSDAEIPNTNGTFAQRNEFTKRKKEAYTNNSFNGWWEVESTICRVVDGISNKLHKEEIDSRLFGLGNAQVPLACAMAWKILTKDLNMKGKL